MIKTIFLYVLAGCLCFSVAESKTKQIPKGKQQEESQLPARGPIILQDVLGRMLTIIRWRCVVPLKQGGLLQYLKYRCQAHR